jgi:hypothetical protein
LPPCAPLYLVVKPRNWFVADCRELGAQTPLSRLRGDAAGRANVAVAGYPIQ